MAERREAILRLSGSIPHRPCHGKFPAVAVNDHGIVIELHQTFIFSASINCQVGYLNGDEVDWSAPSHLDSGRLPKVAINNANCVVEVHEGELTRRIFYRVGKVEGSQKVSVLPKEASGGQFNCKWVGNKSKPFDQSWGKYPAVAVYANQVVITFDRSFFNYTTYYCMGAINEEESDIVWGATSRLFDADAAETSVAMNAEYVVAVGRGWTSFKCCVAQIHTPAPQCGAGPAAELRIKREISLDHFGFCPNICLTANQHIVLVWQSFAMRQVKYAVGRIPAESDFEKMNTIFKDSHRNIDFGYNPTIATSLNGKHLLEMHESNFSKVRCTLHYHTGVLERNDPPSKTSDGDQTKLENESQTELTLPQEQDAPLADSQPQKQDGQEHLEKKDHC